jgi:hypothetical protein
MGCNQSEIKPKGQIPHTSNVLAPIITTTLSLSIPSQNQQDALIKLKNLIDVPSFIMLSHHYRRQVLISFQKSNFLSLDDIVSLSAILNRWSQDIDIISEGIDHELVIQSIRDFYHVHQKMPTELSFETRFITYGEYLKTQDKKQE